MNEIVHLAMESIRANKVQSLLTVIGVVIGVTAVIGMSSVISGLNASINTEIQGMGSDLIFLTRIGPTTGELTPEDRAREFLTIEDAEAIATLPSVRSVAPRLRTSTGGFGAGSYALRYRNRTVAGTIIEGVTADYEDVFNLDLRGGRWINETDHRHRSNVLVMGYDTAETLFPNVDSALGRDVELAGKIFVVVGVLEKRPTGFTAGNNPEDNVVELPVSTFETLYPGVENYEIVLRPNLTVANPGGMNRTIDQVEGLMRRRRAVRYDEANNFAIFTQDSLTDLWNQISGGIFALMLSISSVALLVGGVGVMNIMLVSVTERTREIGIRKAIGATRQMIMFQFLLEAMTLTAAGGVLGILLGSGITVAIRTLVPFLPAQVSPFWVITGFSVSVGTGLIFGMYPAYKASLLDPIEALRYE
jgi:putative ABC transport system permease protein